MKCELPKFTIFESKQIDVNLFYWEHELIILTNNRLNVSNKLVIYSATPTYFNDKIVLSTSTWLIDTYAESHLCVFENIFKVTKANVIFDGSIKQFECDPITDFSSILPIDITVRI